MERYGRNGGALGPRGSGSTPLPFILMHRTQRALVTSVSNCVELRAHVSSAAARAAARECCVVPPGALRGKATGGKSDARVPPGALRGEATGETSDAPVPPGALRGKATGETSDAPVPPGALRGEAPKRDSGAICCAAIVCILCRKPEKPSREDAPHLRRAHSLRG